MVNFVNRRTCYKDRNRSYLRGDHQIKPCVRQKLTNCCDTKNQLAQFCVQRNNSKKKFNVISMNTLMQLLPQSDILFRQTGLAN